MNYIDRNNPFTSGEIDDRPDERHLCGHCDCKEIEPLMTLEPNSGEWVCNDCLEDFINYQNEYK